MKIMLQRVVVILCCSFLIQSNLIAQVSNDECSTATLLEFSDANCDYFQFDFIGASPSAQTINCFSEKNDVWFKYEQADSTAIRISIINISSAKNPYVAKYQSNCFANATCVDQTASEFGNLNHTFEDFTNVTDTAYLRVFAEDDFNDQFLICIQQKDISKENIFCKNAIDIPTQESICDTSLWVYDSMDFHGINFMGNTSFVCYLETPGKWYDVEVPPNKLALVEFTFEEHFDEMQIAVFQDTCGSEAYPISCLVKSNHKSIVAYIENSSDEMVTYHLQLGTNSATLNKEPYVICASLHDPYPNEICEQAITIHSDSSNINCDNHFLLDLNKAWLSNNQGCPGQTFQKDVWFHYYIEKVTPIIVSAEFLSAQSSAAFNVQVYKGSCDSLELVACSSIGNSIWDANHLEFYLDEINQDYFFRIGARPYEDINSLVHNFCFIFPPLPMNNDCVNATWILNQNESYPYSVAGSLNSIENTCSEFPDVWYKFIYTASNGQIIELIDNIDNIFPSRMTLFRGSCNNLVPVACNNELFASIDYLIHNPDLINDTIYIAIHKPAFHTSGSISYGDVRLSQNTNQPKEGEYCSRAMNYNLTDECQFENYTIDGHSFSGFGESCTSYFPLFDTWLTTQLSNDGLIELKYKFSSDDADESFVSLYHGSCNDLEFINCFEVSSGWNEKQLNLSNFFADELFIKFGSKSNDANEISFCAKELNNGQNPLDLCQKSQNLFVQDALCTTPVIFNNLNALQSEITSSCNAYDGGDVWFDFIMPSSGKAVVFFEYVTGSVLVDGAMTIYSGSCDNLNWIACDDDSGSGNMPSWYLNDLSLAGEKIYIQFYSYKNESQGDFGVCVFEPFEAQGNFCHSAILAPIKNKIECQESDPSIANMSANDFSGIEPICGASVQSDIWFSFKSQLDKELIFETEALAANPITDGKAVLYGGNCDSLIFLACSDDDGIGDMPMFNINEILDSISTQIDSLFIQFWDVNGTTSGAFKYCLYENLPDANKNIDPFNINIFPNPTSGLLHLVFGTDMNEKIHIKIFSTEGKILYEKNNHQLLNQNLLIDLSPYPQGLYILKISRDHETKNYNFVKQ